MDSSEGAIDPQQRQRREEIQWLREAPAPTASSAVVDSTTIPSSVGKNVPSDGVYTVSHPDGQRVVSSPAASTGSPRGAAPVVYHQLHGTGGASTTSGSKRNVSLSHVGSSHTISSPVIEEGPPPSATAQDEEQTSIPRLGTKVYTSTGPTLPSASQAIPPATVAMPRVNSVGSAKGDTGLRRLSAGTASGRTTPDLLGRTENSCSNSDGDSATPRQIDASNAAAPPAATHSPTGKQKPSKERPTAAHHRTSPVQQPKAKSSHVPRLSDTSTVPPPSSSSGGAGGAGGGGLTANATAAFAVELLHSLQSQVQEALHAAGNAGGSPTGTTGGGTLRTSTSRSASATPSAMMTMLNGFSAEAGDGESGEVLKQLIVEHQMALERLLSEVQRTREREATDAVAQGGAMSKRRPASSGVRRDPLVAGVVASQPYSSVRAEQEYCLQRQVSQPGGSSPAHTGAGGDGSIPNEALYSPHRGRLQDPFPSYAAEKTDRVFNQTSVQALEGSGLRLGTALSRPGSAPQPLRPEALLSRVDAPMRGESAGPQRGGVAGSRPTSSAAPPATGGRVNSRSPHREQQPIFALGMPLTDPELEVKKLEDHIWSMTRSDAGENLFAQRHYPVSWFVNDPTDLDKPREKRRKKKKHDFELMRNLDYDRRDFVMYYTSDPDASQKRKVIMMAEEMEKFRRQVKGHRAIKEALAARYKEERRKNIEAREKGYAKLRQMLSGGGGPKNRSPNQQREPGDFPSGGRTPASSPERTESTGRHRRGSISPSRNPHPKKSRPVSPRKVISPSGQESSARPQSPSRSPRRASTVETTNPTAAGTSFANAPPPSLPCLEDFVAPLWDTGREDVEAHQIRLFTTHTRPNSASTKATLAMGTDLQRASTLPAPSPKPPLPTPSATGTPAHAAPRGRSKLQTAQQYAASLKQNPTTIVTTAASASASHREQAKGKSFSSYVDQLEANVKLARNSVEESLAKGDSMSWVTTSIRPGSAGGPTAFLGKARPQPQSQPQPTTQKKPVAKPQSHSQGEAKKT